MTKLISEKMGIRTGAHILLIDAPLEAVDAIELPPVMIATAPSDQVFDPIVFFVQSQSVMDQNFPHLMQQLSADGKLWVAWPKGGRLGTDLTIKKVIQIGYSHGLVESTNLRIDDTWTALKFTHPKPGKIYHNSYGKLSQARGDIMDTKKPETEVMKSTKQLLLRNPDIQPTDDAVAKALGEAANAYMKFVNELASRDIQIEWRYYNDGNAWLAKGLYRWTGVRGGQNETTVFWISIWDGFFKVTFYIPEKARLDVLSLPIDDEVKSMISNSKQMGKLKYFPLVFDVCSNEKFETIYTLADFRSKQK